MEDDWRKVARNSIGTRYFSEAIKKFSGDPALAAARLPLARALLGDTIHRAALSGIGYSHRVVRLQDGTIIRITANGGINSISIEASPIPSPDESGIGGFVFYPQLNRSVVVFDNYYPAPKLNATLSVIGDTSRDRAKLKIEAPIDFTPNGDHFEFLGQDVYSWVHRGTGDGPGSLYGTPYLYKNNVLYYILDVGIVGLHPFRYRMSNGASELRFLVGANIGGNDVGIRAYAMRDGEMVLLLGGKTLIDASTRTYYSSRWPVKFNATGTECACIAKYSEEVQVTANPGSGVITIDTYRVSHEIITCSIDHNDNGIEAAVSTRVAGTPHLLKMHEVYSDFRERHSAPKLIDWTTNPPAGGPCGSQNIDTTNSYWEETKTVRTMTRGWEINHPIALDYVGNTLKVWNYKETWDLGHEYLETSRDDGVLTCLDRFEQVGDFCVETVRKLITWTGEIRKARTFIRKNILTVHVAGREVFRGDQSSSEISNWVGTYEVAINGGAQGEPYPIHENPAETQAEYNQRSSDGNSVIVCRYFNVRDDVFLATTATSGRIRTWRGTNVTTRTTSEGTAFTWNGVNEEQFVITRECVLFLHGKKVDTAPSVERGNIEYFLAGAESLLVTSLDFVSADSPTGYITTDTYDTYRDPPTFELFTGTLEFSYASDPRVRGAKLAWMYSLFYYDTKRTVELNPLIRSECTWGAVTPMLPAVDDVGDLTGSKVEGLTLALYPIALF